MSMGDTRTGGQRGIGLALSRALLCVAAAFSAPGLSHPKILGAWSRHGASRLPASVRFNVI